MKLRNYEWGDGGKTALLIHGLFSDARSWHRLAPALVERGYRVIAPDLRGHGESPRSRYSVVDWSLDLIEDLPRGADLAIGHSLGGLALGIAARPLGVREAVYLDPAWRITAEQDAAFGAEWSSWLSWSSIEQLRDHLGSRWPEEDLQLRWESMWAADPAIVPGLATGSGYDHSPERPTERSLVIAADPSQFITDTHGAELIERGFDLRRVTDSGHSLFREDLDGLLEILDGWLAEAQA
ncbi:MAG TPA: alpha/beta fold hydrolase [Solirubrobacterales bacterium]